MKFLRSPEEFEIIALCLDCLHNLAVILKLRALFVVLRAAVSSCDYIEFMLYYMHLVQNIV